MTSTHTTTDELRADRRAVRDMKAREQDLRSEGRALTSFIKTIELRGRALTAQIPMLRGSELVAAEGAIEDIAEDVNGARAELYRIVAHALGFAYSPFDIAAWCRETMEMGCAHPQLDHNLLADLAHIRQVPNAPFRLRVQSLLITDTDALRPITLRVHSALKAVEKATGTNQGSASLIATVKRGPIPQTRYLKRMLGMAPIPNGSKLPSRRLFITYEQAVAFMRALNLTPHDAGI